MKKALIFCLGSSKDLISSAQTAQQIRDENPQVEIHLITFSHHKSKTRLLKCVGKIHYINQEKIQQIVKGQVFSNGFALDVFYSGVQDILDTSWDLVVNHSNDNTSAYLINMLEAASVVGAAITEKGRAHFSDDWNLILNHLNTKNGHRNFIESQVLKSHSLGLPWSQSADAIHIDPDYAIVSGQNFARIRELKKGNVKTVGINLAPGYDGSFLDRSIVRGLISILQESANIIPILLIEANNQAQINIVNELNIEFQNSLISINLDLTALPAVTTNLDLMISPANSQLMVANQLETPLIEIRNSSAFQVEPIATNVNSRVIYFENPEDILDDIIICTNEICQVELPISSVESANQTYMVVKDAYSFFFTQIRGPVNLKDELNYHLGRSVLFNTLGYPENVELFNNLRDNCQPAELNDYILEVNGELTAIVKVLLASLRSLKSIRTSNTNPRSFITYYDQLIAYTEGHSIASSLIQIMEAKIDSLPCENVSENLIQVEKYLFELKANLQRLTSACNQLIEPRNQPSKNMTT